MQTHGANAQKQYITNRKLMKQKPREKTILACEFCDRNFVYRKSFLHHLRSEHKVLENETSSLRKYMKVVSTDVKTETISSDQLDINMEIKIEEEDFYLDNYLNNSIKQEFEDMKNDKTDNEEDEDNDHDNEMNEDSEMSTDKKDCDETFLINPFNDTNQNDGNQTDEYENDDNSTDNNKVTIKGTLTLTNISIKFLISKNFFRYFIWKYGNKNKN